MPCDAIPAAIAACPGHSCPRELRKGLCSRRAGVRWGEAGARSGPRHAMIWQRSLQRVFVFPEGASPDEVTAPAVFRGGGRRAALWAGRRAPAHRAAGAEQADLHAGERAWRTAVQAHQAPGRADRRRAGLHADARKVLAQADLAVDRATAAARGETGVLVVGPSGQRAGRVRSLPGRPWSATARCSAGQRPSGRRGPHVPPPGHAPAGRASRAATSQPRFGARSPSAAPRACAGSSPTPPPPPPCGWS